GKVPRASSRQPDDKLLERRRSLIAQDSRRLKGAARHWQHARMNVDVVAFQTQPTSGGRQHNYGILRIPPGMSERKAQSCVRPKLAKVGAGEQHREMERAAAIKQRFIRRDTEHLFIDESGQVEVSQILARVLRCRGHEGVRSQAQRSEVETEMLSRGDEHLSSSVLSKTHRRLFVPLPPRL